MRRVFDERIFDHFDWPLFGCVCIILALGLMNLYSATYQLPLARFFPLQAIWVLIGMGVLLALLFFDYRLVERMAYPIYVLALILLAFVLFKGKVALGAQRWLQIGPLSIQPSELIKPAVVLAFARFFHRRHDTGPLGFRHFIGPALLAGIPVVLILKQPDLGTALIVTCVSGAMILFAGVQKKLILSLAALLAVAGPVAWTYGLHDYQKDRITTFLSPEKDARGKGYQTIQSRIAIGSGELLGRGYLKGTQTKLQFLPKQHTDFIFSNFAEEFGFLGTALILFLYASFTLLGVNVALTSKEQFGMLLAFGLAVLVGAQAWINLAMESGLLPVVGVPLPLFSYGGTSLLATLAAIGMLLNISMRRYLF
ncbi:MAG: rod shape-determining protein RodA [Pseudomonadota bacterium]